MQIEPATKWLLAVSILVYLVFMYAIAIRAKRKIHDVEDYLVAGRRLPLNLAWMTLLATWFGAGTMLTAADEVRRDGLQKAALDPWGAGACLILAAAFVAGPMWRMNLLTVPDFFKRKFGSSAEMISAMILVPSYFGWIAAQLTALAEVLQLFFGIPLAWGLVLVAIVGAGYTLMGGMWSVTLTDAAQVCLLLVGLVVLAGVVLMELGHGNAWTGGQRILSESDPELLIVIPMSDASLLIGWLGVFAIGALGNLPGQDLMQRIFAANSERTAQLSCYIAGTLYLLFGSIPLMLALGGRLLFPDEVDTKILPALADAFMHPVVAVIFLLALLSAVLSTIDSAILSPASILAQNVFPRLGYADTMFSNRVSVFAVSVCSLLLAYTGESAYELLEASYLLTLVGLFVPLIIGLYSVPYSGLAAIASMLVGTAVWMLHLFLGWESFLEPLASLNRFPISLAATGCSLLAYFVLEPPWRIQWRKSKA